MGLFRTAVARDDKQADVTVRVPDNNADEVSIRMILSEEAFMSMLYLERRRAERAQKRYVLLLVDVKDAISDKQKIRTVQKITRTICSVTRETDIIGWYVHDHILGVIATTFIIRTRYRVKHSLYTSVRQQHARQIERARDRALASRATENAAVAGRAESALEVTLGLISLGAALGLVLMGVIMAIGVRS